MRKRDVLCVLALVVGGLLSLGEGAVVGVPLSAACAYLLVADRVPDRRTVTAAVAPLGR